jgi:hypothetical protein
MIYARVSTDSFQNQKWVDAFRYHTVMVENETGIHEFI